MSTELEERLRERMDHATATIAVPRGLARRAARRRQRRITIQAGAAVATAAAVTAAVVVSTAARTPSDTGATATARLASDVESAVAATAANYDILHTHSILHVQGANGQQDETWYYRGPGEQLRRIEVFSASGQPLADEGTSWTANRFTSVSVIYAVKRWRIQTWRQTGPGQVPAPQTSCNPSISVSPWSDPSSLAADIREALSCGQLTDDGTEYVNGVNAIKLVSVRSMSHWVFTTILWVDPATYLPVQFRNAIAHVTHPWSGTWSVTWLPPTTANLAPLQVPIPAGFTQAPK
jgi:hypothetical protein